MFFLPSLSIDVAWTCTWQVQKVCTWPYRHAWKRTQITEPRFWKKQVTFLRIYIHLRWIALVDSLKQLSRLARFFVLQSLKVLCLHFSAREAKVQLEGRMPANPKARHGSFRDMLWTLLWLNLNLANIISLAEGFLVFWLQVLETRGRDRESEGTLWDQALVDGWCVMSCFML